MINADGYTLTGAVIRRHPALITAYAAFAWRDDSSVVVIWLSKVSLVEERLTIVPAHSLRDFRLTLSIQ
jgi:hypothetical protein